MNQNPSHNSKHIKYLRRCLADLRQALRLDDVREQINHIDGILAADERWCRARAALDLPLVAEDDTAGYPERPELYWQRLDAAVRRLRFNIPVAEIDEAAENGDPEDPI